MNKKFLPLNILALILIVALTSCNRQNLPEFASGRFHHKEQSNKRPDESTLALQQRNEIAPLAPKAPQGLQVTVANENLQPAPLKNNLVTHSLTSKRITKKTNKQLTAGQGIQSKSSLKPRGLHSSIANLNTPEDKVAKGRDRGDRVLCAVIAIFIPFLGVGLYEGIDTDFWIDLILCIFFWVPGIIFALIVILSD